MNGQGDAGDSPSATVSTTFGPDSLASSLKTRLGVRPGDHLCVAYSGGMDSHALLHALTQLRDDFPFQLRAVHIDHGLHPDSQSWAEHCMGVCDQLGVDMVTLQLHLKPEMGASVEAAARSARYAAFSAVVHDGEYCLTAQHADDQAETILLQLLRGAGMHGMAGMPDVTDFGIGKLGRPLLGVTRTALAHYASKHELEWCDDPSNTDSRFDRNYLRNNVMPLIHERWPSATASLVRSAGHAATAAHLLEEQGRLDLTEVGAHNIDGNDDCVACLDVDLFEKLTRERQANALRCWIRRYSIKLPSHARLDAALETLVRNNSTSGGHVQWPGASFRRDGDLVFLCREIGPVSDAFHFPVFWDPACLLKLPGSNHVLEAIAVVGQGCALAKIQGRKLKVDTRRGGETCRMAAGFGRKPLRKVFQDLGVPRWQRDSVPLVFLDDELIAVGHYWLNSHLAPDSDSSGLVFMTRQAHVSIENRRAL